ncbi:DUF4369 domain-containing protein, partial [Flavobacteriales bacterium]|nr:DUF4369 domain-containing protein [Flavobacteriales bacterium]
MKKNLLFILVLIVSSSLMSQEYTPNGKGEVVVSGQFGGDIKSKSGKIFLYEMIGSLEYILDSTYIKDMKFVFPKKTYYTGIYRLALNNSNYLDFIINPSESQQNNISVQINSHRINKNYNVVNSIENRMKKQYDVKDKSIASKIKL